MPHAAIDSADTTNALRRVSIDALFGPVGRHPWVNEAGKVDAAKAGTWMANIILMAGGSPKTAFACALEVATDITDNPAKFKDFAPWPNDNTEEIKLMNQKKAMNTQKTPPPMPFLSIALFGLGLSDEHLPPVSRETHGPGICGYCGERSAVLKTEPRSQRSYCRKCAPGRETDADWSNV